MNEFCIVPWFQLASRASGNYGLCCMSEYSDSESSCFDEHWNSRTMKDIRVSMMSGKIHPVYCVRCTEESKNVTVPKYISSYNKQISEKEIQLYLSRTSQDGHLDSLPISLDIRTDECNFRCRHCFPSLSSSIRKLTNEPTSQKDLSKFHLSDEFFLNLKRVKWGGGEPFLGRLHWYVIDRLIEVNNLSVILHYTSNMSFPGNSYERARSKLALFSDLRFNASLDGYGEDVEFIRDGISYASYLETLKKVNEDFDARMSIAFTSTSIGLLNLDKMIEDIEALKFITDICFTNSYLPDGHYLRVNVLNPRSFFDCIHRITQKLRGTRFQTAGLDFLAMLQSNYSHESFDEVKLYRDSELRDQSGSHDRYLRFFR